MVKKRSPKPSQSAEDKPEPVWVEYHPTCASCRYWTGRVDQIKRDKKRNDYYPKELEGYCRRHASSDLVRLSSHWCGEHEPLQARLGDYVMEGWTKVEEIQYAIPFTKDEFESFLEILQNLEYTLRPSKHHAHRAIYMNTNDADHESRGYIRMLQDLWIKLCEHPQATKFLSRK